jgi:hypothetical protein
MLMFDENDVKAREQWVRYGFQHTLWFQAEKMEVATSLKNVERKTGSLALRPNHS